MQRQQACSFGAAATPHRNERTVVAGFEFGEWNALPATAFALYGSVEHVRVHRFPDKYNSRGCSWGRVSAAICWVRPITAEFCWRSRRRSSENQNGPANEETLTIALGRPCASIRSRGKPWTVGTLRLRFTSMVEKPEFVRHLRR